MEIKKGIGVSPGVVISTAIVLDAEDLRIPKRIVEAKQVPAEIERLNQALKRYLSRAALGQPPYTTTAELLAEIRPAMPNGSEHLVEDLFEKVTMFNNTVVAATFTERSDGTYLVRLELEAHKRRADGAGGEREIPIDDWIDIALWREGGDGKADGAPLFFERRRIRTALGTVEIVVGQRPARVVIDPYYELIDRDRGDNVRAVLPAGIPAGR